MRSKLAKVVLENFGIDVTIAYGVFLILALFVNLFATGGFITEPRTLVDLLSVNRDFTGAESASGKGTILVLVATASIAIPYFWKHRFAPLAFAVPLLFTIYAFWPLYEQHRAQQQAMEAMGDLMGQLPEQMSGGGPFDSFGVAAYLLFATVIYLAFKGVMHSLARSG
ncbi:MAG: hypothetical protein ACRES3_09910 [Steroidobacteraceae bacterium]